MGNRDAWRRVSWSLPWLLFLWFPVADLLTTERPAGARAAAGAVLLAFVVVYLRVMATIGQQRTARPECWLAAALAVGLGVAMGPDWAGLMIYIAGAAAAALPERWVWPTVAGATAICAGVLLAAGGDAVGLLFLPPICALTAFGIRGTRYLMTVNSELREAREELARTAIAEERLRFARDLHDLLGHSLSLIALKSELARRLADRDPAAARREMADVEQVARQALTEVREAVSGYRQVSLVQALAEARSALAGAGVAVRVPAHVPTLPAEADAALGWVVREATTNVLRHAAATTVTVALDDRHGGTELTVDDDGTGAAAGAAPGSGLSGLRERVAALGGELTTGTAPGGGFRLTARVPAGRPVPVPAATP